jgi:glucuronate isomerase
MDFIHEDFLLQTESARRLYHGYAENAPILDYHSHLPASDIAKDRSFRNLYEIWLENDHYKWRAMRANGIAEEFCTGNAPPDRKFLAWARTVPFALRNPLYHWTHLELKRYFGISTLLDEATAEAVWRDANAQLQQPHLSVHGILRKFDVRLVCTSDDPADNLMHHRAIANGGTPCTVLPTFRPDRALLVHKPNELRIFIEELEKAVDREIRAFPDFLNALEKRHDDFHQLGARLSDHGLPYCYAAPCSDAEAARIFANAGNGQPASPAEHEGFAAVMMLFFGRLDAAKGWTKQLHLGPLRSVNTRALRQIGPHSGFDTIGDHKQVERLCAYFDLLEKEGSLPRTIVYNLNPADNYAIAAALGSFQDGSIAGKIQLGSAWWFLDQREGIEWQLNALSNTGLLTRFIGMVTDSRSFMSFPRHEYFRRVLCNLIGAEMERGLLPNDEVLLGTMVRNVCFENARAYLGLAAEAPPATQQQAIERPGAGDPREE